MWNRYRNINLMLVLLVAVIIGSVLSAPMYYKRKDNDIFEPDLVPVSSTVIPLAEYKVSSDHNATHHSLPLSEEYKLAYMKLVQKRAKEQPEDPDTLITLTRKYNPEKSKHENNEDARVVVAV